MENREPLRERSTNLCTFRLQIPENCLPIHNERKGKFNHAVDENALRAEGKTNIDLWTRGELYPRDPILNTHPQFNSPTGLLKFTSKGNHGLLGYCRNLVSGYSDQNLRAVLYQTQMGNFQLKYQHDALVRHNDVLGRQNSLLIDSCNSLQTQIQKIQEGSAHLEQSLMLERAKSKRLLEEKENLERRMKRLKSTLGARERKKSMKAIDVLRPGGGAQRRVRAIKTLMDPSMENKGKRGGHLAGVLKKIVCKDDVLNLINLPGTNLLKKAVIENVLIQLNEEQDIDQIQYACDSAGISRNAYIQLFKALKTSTTISIKKPVLPNISRIWSCRNYRNQKIRELLGPMTHIESTISVKFLDKNANKGKKVQQVTENKFILDAKNNCWVDIENLLKLMVKFYDMKMDDCNGKLIIAIKLDEMEMIKDEKYERVSLTLMNRAMGRCNREKENFSVQSEENIWWLGIFQVPKESHAVLKWVFDQTSIPALIASHGVGEKLVVPSYGAYEVEWHMAADLKTIKFMFNMKHGASKATQACPYCCFTAKDKNANARGSNQRNGQVSSSTLDCDQNFPPCREEKDSALDPVFAIGLRRVHICTLHAFLRIIDKMVYMSILFAWNKTPASSKEASLAAIEKVMSDMGFHGRNYKIIADPKRAGNVPSRPSMGGAKAKRFLPSLVAGKTGKWECYKDLLRAEDDRTDRGMSYQRKMKAWQAFYPLVELMSKKQLQDKDVESFKNVVTDFTKAFVAAWGEGELTHYIHILYAHGPWFAKEYGSLGIWNTQGMEKSHKQAKNVYFRFTQHGGTRRHSNSLQQMSTWFYRRVVAKLERRDIASKETTLACMLKKRLRANRWHRSSASSTLTRWRAQRERQGRKYIVAAADGDRYN